MSSSVRMLQVVGEMADDGPFQSVLATTFNFDAEFFVNTGVLPALAGADRVGSGTAEHRRHVDAAVVRDILGNPFVGVLQGCPSRGPTPGWIDRTLWPTRRLGVLHAKCLIVVGRERTHILVTSANLTDGSWCRNLEVAVSWSASRSPTSVEERGRAEAAANVIDGVRIIAEAAGAHTISEQAAALVEPLRNGNPSEPRVVWSGPRFVGKPLDGMASGDELVVTSPFWPGEQKASVQVMRAFQGTAPTVTLVGRSTPGGTRLEAPLAIHDVAVSAQCQFRVAQAPPEGETQAGLALFRPLHGKQLSVRSGAAWRSYVGSANGTVQGLALNRRRNTELGVIVDVGPLLRSTPATGTPVPPSGPDPDDPDSFGGTVADEGVSRLDDRFALARLSGDGLLELHAEPAPPSGSSLELAPGSPPVPMLHKTDQALRLDDLEMEALIRRPEITLLVPDRPELCVPVLLDEALKLRVGGDHVGGGDVEVDELLDQLRRNPTARPDEENSGSPPEPDDEVGHIAGNRRRVVPRRPVHRAREAIEVIADADRALGSFLEGGPPERLVALRIGGAGTIVDLARRVAATAGTNGGMGTTASAFVVIEVERLLKRLVVDHAAYADALHPLDGEVSELGRQLLKSVEQSEATTAKRLRQLRGSA